MSQLAIHMPLQMVPSLFFSSAADVIHGALCLDLGPRSYFFSPTIQKRFSKKNVPEAATPGEPGPSQGEKDEFAGPETGHALKLKVYVPSVYNTHMQIYSLVEGPTQGLIVCLLFSLHEPYVAAS